ncbi:MAG: GNAT family N-acetyltransferase [Myroides sp.]
MKFEPKQITLKNKKTVVIRQAGLSDAENLLNCIKTYILTSNYIPKLESEIKLKVDQEKEWIDSFLIYDNSLLLVAEYEGKIIGNIDLTGNRRKIMEHTAIIGMGMLQEWENIGLGTALLSAIIEWAKNNPILELIWLQVYTENEAGLNLYRKMGFVENGIIQNFFKKDNEYFHNLTMTLMV